MWTGAAPSSHRYRQREPSHPLAGSLHPGSLSVKGAGEWHEESKAAGWQQLHQVLAGSWGVTGDQSRSPTLGGSVNPHVLWTMAAFLIAGRRSEVFPRRRDAECISIRCPGTERRRSTVVCFSVTAGRAEERLPAFLSKELNVGVSAADLHICNRDL
ncbi:hypothetical protein NDU88_008249 [Pleurodeles waltl]|uniref:Uncharacterized protein n=1 Tax=Pleurodeles waltl TaxID=8319 RepID=A0AAV7U320_PLEWA|nr:hypothetical protein NDU88_008249 [Pleurodeles waltl]